MPSVCAVVLTYNRRELLNDCLQAIVAQSHPCDRVIVVDNASSDGTAEMLAQQWPGQADVHVLEQNIGAAGGFNLGIRLAYQSGADCIWVMDDDVIPASDALEQLLAAADLLVARDITPPFLVSVACSPDGTVTNVPEIDRRRNLLGYENWPDLLNHKLIPVTRATLVSNLLPRTTLTQYGLPISPMFIWGEDTEFTLRVTREQPAYLVGSSCVMHFRQLPGVLDIRTERSPTRVAYHFHKIRNDVYLKRRFEGPRAVARVLRQQAKLVLELCWRRDFAKAQVVLRGTIAGLVFNPVLERADAPFIIVGLRHLAQDARAPFDSPAEEGASTTNLPRAV